MVAIRLRSTFRDVAFRIRVLKESQTMGIQENMFDIRVGEALENKSGQQNCVPTKNLPL